jgi:hypothetical protein
MITRAMKESNYLMNRGITVIPIITLHMHYLEAIIPHFLQHMLSSKLSAIECESGNVRVQWNNIRKYMLDTMSDLSGKVQRIARKPWLTQAVISTMDDSTMKKVEELQKTEEQIEKSHRQGQ